MFLWTDFCPCVQELVENFLTISSTLKCFSQVFIRLTLVPSKHEAKNKTALFLLGLVVVVWEGGGICTVNLWPVKDTGVPTLVVTDCTDGVPEEEMALRFQHPESYFNTWIYKSHNDKAETHRAWAWSACWWRRRHWGEAPISCWQTTTPGK